MQKEQAKAFINGKGQPQRQGMGNQNDFDVF